MTLPYVSPAKMDGYRQRIVLFARGSNSLSCIHSHYFPDRTGSCDLTGSKEEEELFVLSNRSGATLKVSKRGMQIVANIVEIGDADHWYERMKELKRLERDKKVAAEKVRAAQRAAPRALIFKKQPRELLEKNKNS